MLRNLKNNARLALKPARALSFFSRLAGLMGRKRFPRQYDALIFEKCNSIHCFFMLMEIDVLFTDKENRVVKCFSRLKPWRLAFGGRKGVNCIELPAGIIEETGTQPGDKIVFED